MEKCPRCNKKIICLRDDIEHCACTSMSIEEEVITFIEERYESCLCNDCLSEIEQQLSKSKLGE